MKKQDELELLRNDETMAQHMGIPLDEYREDKLIGDIIDGEVNNLDHLGEDDDFGENDGDDFY